MKNLIYLILVSSLLLSCQKDQKMETPDTEQSQPEVVTLTFDQFKTNPEQYVDKYVRIEGTCVHTCKHGGKKMHIVGADPEFVIKVDAGKDVVKFDKALEGSDVMVEGIVKVLHVDEAYLNNWENELKADVEKQKEAGEVTEEHEMNMEQIANLRMELKKSGKDKISYYSIECTNYKEKKAES